MVVEPAHPEFVGGFIARYVVDGNVLRKEKDLGHFGFNRPEVPLGQNTNELLDKYIAIGGVVTHHDGDFKTPYRVVVTIRQGGVEIEEFVPNTNGSGFVAATQRFAHIFKIEKR